MKFKTGVLLDSLQLDLDKALAAAAESGADGVQMYAVPHAMSALKLQYTEAKGLKEKITGYGLEIASLCGDTGGHGFERREENSGKIEKMLEIIDFAAELETPVITTHIGVISERGTEKREIMLSALHRICRYAEEKGIFVAVETGAEKAAVLRDFIIESGERNLKVNFDPANLVMVQGEDPSAAVFILKDFIVHTHAKDGRMIRPCDPVTIYNAFAEGNPDAVDIDSFFLELPLGTGDVNFPRYLASLESIGYSGYLTIEREAGDNRVKDVMDGLHFLKELIK